MHYLNTFVQHNKINFIYENSTELISKSNSAREIKKRFSNLNTLTYGIMDSIERSVGEHYDI